MQSLGRSVSLKEAVSLNQLPQGVLLELDTEKTPPNNFLEEEEEESEDSYAHERMLDQLNPECLNFSAGNDTEADTDQLVNILVTQHISACCIVCALLTLKYNSFISGPA